MLSIKEFSELVSKNIINKTLNNPGGGTTTFLKLSNSILSYKRGKSTIRVEIEYLYNAMTHFYNKKCSCTDLKIFNPSVFSTKNGGHDCNCTILFLILYELKIIEQIKGRGVKGSPFYIELIQNTK